MNQNLYWSFMVMRKEKGYGTGLSGIIRRSMPVGWIRRR